MNKLLRIQSFLLGALVAFIFLLTTQSVNAESFSEKIKVAQFNTWGVPLVTWDTWRYRKAMKSLVELDPDFILLNEVFTKKGRRSFRSELYPYVAKGPGSIPRVVGSGLRILSKHRIDRSAILVYRSCQKDDCLSRKGAVLAVITLPSQQKVNVVSTHLNARGEDATRMDQLKQLKEFVDYYAEPGAPILIGGDFNFAPETVAYQYLQSTFQLKDTWGTLRGSEPGYTYDAIHNDYANDYSLRTGFPLSRERIDYLFTENEAQASSRNATRLIAEEARLIFNEQPHFSDHFGIFATYKLAI